MMMRRIKIVPKNLVTDTSRLGLTLSFDRTKNRPSNILVYVQVDVRKITSLSFRSIDCDRPRSKNHPKEWSSLRSFAASCLCSVRDNKIPCFGKQVFLIAAR